MKIKKYKRKKKKTPFYKKKVFWYSLLILIFISGLVYLFLFSPIFRIQDIKASGCNFLDCERIEQTLGTKTRILFLEVNNLFLFNKKQAKKIILENYLDVDDLSIKKKLSGVILLDVSERKEKAVIQGAEKMFLIDKNGFVFRRIESLPELPKICFKKDIFLKDRLVDKKDLNIILELEKELKEKTALSADCYFLLEDRLEVSIKDRNFSLYFDKTKDIVMQIDDLFLVLSEEIDKEELEYIDLRFDKIFYK
jgi:cell division septal protein FtsQ